MRWSSFIPGVVISVMGPAGAIDVELDGPIAQALRTKARQVSQRMGSP